MTRSCLPARFLTLWMGVSLLGCVASGGGADAPATDRAFVAPTKEYLGKLEKLGFAGSVLVARHGQPLLEAGYGLADRESNVRWTPSTISTVGSITKQFTSAAILTLEEEGRLSVEDPITKYFADVPPDKREITLHQLLTHSSGIVDLRGAGDWDPIDRETFVRRALAQDLAFPPGTSYAYSNAGYSLLGAIIEQLTGESYERYVHDRLFAPNGMEHTGYLLADWHDLPMAIGYLDGKRWGTVLGRPMAPDGPYWVLRCNGGIHSNAEDMLRWADALLAGRVLSPASMEKLWSPHVDQGGGESYYGYGWVIKTGPGGRKLITHDGGNGIYFADYTIVPEDGLVALVMTNTASEGRAAQELLDRILACLYQGALYPAVPDRIEADSTEVAAFAGSYRLTDTDAFQVSASGNTLQVEPKGREAFAVLHSTRPLDRERVTQLSDRIDGLVAAFMGGEFGPISEAYGGRVSPARLKTLWGEKVAELAEKMGSIQGYQVLGSALRDERDVTVVRFRFERGHLDRAYVWTLDAEPLLRGVSMRGVNPVLRFVPVGEAAFGSWDGGITASKPLRFERAGGGAWRMELGKGSATVWAEGG